MKGVGYTEYYSKSDIGFNKEWKWYNISGKTYIKNVCDKIKKLTEYKLKKYGLKLKAGDQSEMNNSDLLSPNDIPIYKMLIS